jgi:hypothetical protein
MQNTFYGEMSSVLEVLLWEIITICDFIFTFKVKFVYL